MATQYQQTILIAGDTKQFEQALTRIFKKIGLIQRKARKLSQTSLQLGRVRSRSQNIRGQGLNTSTGQRAIPRDADGNVLVSKSIERQINSLNKANAALNDYVRKTATATGAQKSFTGSTNKISTQVSTLKDRLKGLARSNSEYTSTLQAVQRGEQALFQNRNKRLGDESRTLGSRGGNRDLVKTTIGLGAKDITQSIDGLNNYISRLEVLKNKVNINSREFKLLENRIAEVNIQLNEAQLMGQSTQMPRGPGNASGRFVSLNSPEAFRQRESYQDQISSIQTQKLAIQDRIYDSTISQADKLKLINQLDQTNVEIKNNQLKTAKENNTQVDKQLKKLKEQDKFGADAKRRRNKILSSAGIGAGFPLLFGGGPLQALAGGIGGGLGERFTPGGGFAGSIVATAIVQTISKAVAAISDLGKALGPFTQNTEAVVSSLGLQNTVQEAQIRLIEQVQGKTAAFNAAMKLMANDIGQRGVDALKQFGESSRILSSEFTLAITKLQAFAASVANFVLRITGLENRLKKADAGRIVGAAAVRGNSQALGLIQRQKQIDEMDARGGEGKRKEALQAQLDIEKQIFAIREQQKTKLAEITLEHDQAVQKNKEELQLKEAVKKLTEGGMSEAIAKEVAKREQLRDKVLEEVDALADALRLERAKLGNTDTELKRLKEIDAVLADILKKRQQINDETANAVGKIKTTGEEIKKVKVTKEEIANLLANEMTNALMGLIEGTKSLGESLASIAKSLANMFLNAAFQNMFNNIFSIKGEQGLYSRSGGFKAFQQGGVVNSPMLGLIGEGGESEYVIPASKMDGAMSRYSAGARGAAVIPGGSGDPGTVAGGTGSTIVEYTGPTLNFNGDEYVPKSAVPEIIGAAAKRGAQAGKAQAFGSLKNSRSQRASLGL